MNVKLLQITTKSADYEFKAENHTEIPFEIFQNLVGTQEAQKDNVQELLLFKSKDEYLKANADVDLGIDKEKPVYVGGAGQIFCFRKDKNKETETIENDPANTKEN